MYGMFNYCPDCGGSGIDINGDVCHCRMNVQTFYDSVSCLDIPEQYRGLAFNSALVPTDVNESYASFLQDIHDSIVAGKYKDRNVVIASPINHSKTILAYSCIEVLFRGGVPVFPVYDLLELKRMLTDMDLCRKSVYDVEEPERIITVPILFVKIPRITSWEVYDIFSMLLDRRVRRGNSTIFLYDGTWGQFIYNDKNDIAKGLVGDGTYNTVEVKSWSSQIEEGYTAPQDNIG